MLSNDYGFSDRTAQLYGIIFVHLVIAQESFLLNIAFVA